MNKNQIVPQKFDEVVFENENLLIKKVCFWENCDLWPKGNKYLLEFKLPDGKPLKIAYTGIDALLDGTGGVEVEYNGMGNFSEGLAGVAVKGKGCGYINEDLELVVPLKYYSVRDFKDGFAAVCVLDEESSEKKWLFIDKEGKEHFFEKNYKEVSGYFGYKEGMFMVSDFDMEEFSLAFFSDYDRFAGIWGYADTTGKEIIKPQYIYALGFEHGLALVCKGEWTKDKKWDNKYKTRGYWTETELWGVIDKTGKEIIPCKFDEIIDISILGTYDYIWAHYGGWKEGKWGIINNSGEWLVKPIFESHGYEISDDGLFTFYNGSDPDELPMGIYSIKEQRVLFEPQFFDVDFLNDGTIKVEVYDENLKRNIEKIIDVTGKVLFDTHYSYFSEKNNMYMVGIRDDTGKRLNGLIDKEGNEIFPCKYEIPYDGFLFDRKLIIFGENDKYGIVTFDDEVIIPPQYTSIERRRNDNFKDDIYEVRAGGRKGYHDGKCGLITLDGTSIIPTEYSYIYISGELIKAKNDSGTTFYRIFHKDKHTLNTGKQ